ncbi:MAG TPA: AMP-binding protein [Candidatus Limnocylindria bacterium]|nr:AMP-binding protein [Candidatus Limnocylindria bacterium]
MDLLRQPLHAIRAAQNVRLVEMLALCARGHDFYRRRWTQAGVDVAAVRTVDDLERLPPTGKRDLMDDPEAFRLRVPGLPLHERALWNVLHTTGSTGDPTPLYVTTHDYEANLFQCRRVADIAGLRDTDVIANLFPLTPAAMGSFVRAAENAYAIGAAVVAALTGAPHGRFDVHRSLEEAVALVDRRRATVLWGVPSFLRRVIIRAHELGADFRSVRMCALTGEATTAGMREDMRERLRALGVARPIMFDRYGSTEGGALAQCREEGDWHNPAPELLYHEVIDPDTGRRLPDGERGVLAITHLDRRGTVLVRYMVGDVVAMTHEPCPHCGRNGDRLVGPVVRTKDLMKVKGMLMSPGTLQEAIRLVPGVDEFQVVVARQDPADPYSMDELVVRVATRRSDVARLTDEVVAAAATATGIRPRVELTGANDIYDPSRDAKAQRFVDRRTI